MTRNKSILQTSPQPTFWALRYQRRYNQRSQTRRFSKALRELTVRAEMKKYSC